MVNPSPIPRRKTGLTSRTPLQAHASSPILRCTELAKVSSARRRENRERTRLKRDLVDNRGGLCEIRWDDNCTGLAVDVDEIKARSAGGSITDPANVQLGCRHCHDMKHAHPTESRRRGLTDPSWSPDRRRP